MHDCFTLTELLAYEDLGFCEKGSAKEHIASGTFELGGELPVNTDGGLKTFGHPTGATGVRMIYENYKQLQGKAEKRQVKNADASRSATTSAARRRRAASASWRCRSARRRRHGRAVAPGESGWSCSAPRGRWRGRRSSRSRSSRSSGCATC